MNQPLYKFNFTKKSTDIINQIVEEVESIEQQLTTTFSADTIIVPDDYPTIQEAVNHANDGDRIEVRAGIYYEHIVVNKSVNIIGDGSSVTFIDGGGEKDVIFNVKADDVEISGFTIQHCFESASGVRLYGNSCYIHDNVIHDCGGNVEIYWIIFSYLLVLAGSISLRMVVTLRCSSGKDSEKILTNSSDLASKIICNRKR